MKILFVAHSADLYGASRALLRLARRLAQDGHEPLVVVPEHGPLVDALAKDGVASRVIADLAIVERKHFATWGGRLGLVGKFARSLAALRRVIREFRPDVVHSNTSVLLAAGRAARWCGVPHVHHVREIYHDFAGFWPLYRRFLLANADAMVCISDAVARQFPPGEKIHVVHDALPADEFPAPGCGGGWALRARFGIPPDALLAVIVGRVKLKRKGQETFVAAAAQVQQRFPDSYFLIAGAPFAGNEHHLAELKKMAADSGLGGRVVFAGELPDSAAVFDACDVAVTASGTPEPFGLVTLEAMAMGRPVIGTNIGGTPEIISDGETGLLVPPNDSAALAAALARLFADAALRKQMGDAGRMRFLDRFEFEAHYGRLAALYRELTTSPA